MSTSLVDRWSLPLGAADRIDLGRISVDTVSLRAKRGAHTGANPVDRGKAGSKLHLAGDNGVGVPLAVILTAANVPDGTMLEALVDDLPAVRMPHGRRRRRPGTLDDLVDGVGERAGAGSVRRVWDREVGPAGAVRTRSVA